MDEKRTDLKAALRELAADSSDEIGPHVGMKRLIAYRQGTLPAAEREVLQEHLSLCSRCTGLLRELRDFETASAGNRAAGPQALKDEAWASLVRKLPRLPDKPATILPISAGRPAKPRRAPPYLYAAAAALALAVAGLSLWSAVSVQKERGRLASLEQRLVAREEALAAVRRSLAATERQLGAARGQIQQLEAEKAATSTTRGQDGRRMDELTARVAELTSALAELRRAAQPERVALASREVGLSVAPRFALRGQKPPELQPGGAVNPVAVAPQPGRFTVAVNLADLPRYGDYRFELSTRDGQVLWTGRRPAKALLGDAGTSVSIDGLRPGLYRLRIEGLQPDRTELLGEYLLDVAFSPAPS